jgi:large subunit ribosomal protein L30
MKKLQIKLIRSVIKRAEHQRKVAEALGLHKMNRVKVHDDNPVIRGMIYQIRHLLDVKEVDE